MVRQEDSLINYSLRGGCRARTFFTQWLLGLLAALVLGCGEPGATPSGGTSRDAPLLAIAAPREQFAPNIRVNISGRAVKNLRVAVDVPFRVTPAQSSRVLASLPRLDECTITAGARGIALGPHQFPSGRVDVIPEGGGTFRVGDHVYRGVLRLIRRPGGRVLAVNVVSLPDYLASVVDSEMPAAFPKEARKAQAVVARTYALYQMQQQSAGQADYDVFADVRSQKYLGQKYRDRRGRWLAGESDSSRRAVSETAGQVVIFEGRLFCTYFSAACGGRTTRGLDLFSDAAGCLAPVACEWCREARLYRWTAQVDREEAQVAFSRHFASQRKAFGSLTAIETVRDALQTGTGEFVVVDDAGRRYVMISPEMRTLFSRSGISSPSFRLELSAGGLKFDGRGHGHGVGLCQWGARGQAKEGRSYRQIIAEYYRKSRLVVLQAVAAG